MMMTYREFAEKMMPECSDGTAVARAYNEWFRDHAEVGDGATLHLWTDAQAYTIVRRTAKTLTLRRCKVKKAAGWKPEWVPGGFSAVCVNNADQEWEYEEDDDGYMIRAVWSDRAGCFRHEGTLIVSPGRHEFYDYNF